MLMPESKFDWLETVEPSDSQLVRKFKAGDESAATLIYTRYGDRLRKFAGSQCSPTFSGRFDADDVAQSVFLAFFLGVRDSTYAVSGNGIWGLLSAFTVNKIRNLTDYHKAAKRSVHRTARPADLIEEQDDSGGLDELRLVLEDELAKLSEFDREIVRLRFEGYAVQEIADQMCRSLRTVERTIQDLRVRMSPVLGP